MHAAGVGVAIGERPGDAEWKRQGHGLDVGAFAHRLAAPFAAFQDMTPGQPWFPVGGPAWHHWNGGSHHGSHCLEGGVWCSGYDAGLTASWSVDRIQVPAVGGGLSCWGTPGGSRGPGAAGVPSDVGQL